MADPDPTPKLRVVEENEAADDGVVRLGGEKPGSGSTSKTSSPAPQAYKSTANPAEPAERLESASRENFEGRSIEPGVEAILEQAATSENIEQPWGTAGRRLSGIPYGWFIVIGAVIAGGGIWSFVAMRKGEVKVEVAHEVVREKVEEDIKKEAAARELVDKVEDVLRQYLAADTIEAILPVIRHPERMRPLIEDEWKTKPKKSLAFKRLAMFQPAQLEGKPFWIVRAELEDGSSENLLLEDGGADNLRVDWETQVGRQPMPWEEYVAKRPSDRSYDFRLWAVRDNHYSHEFADSAKWQCFRIITKDSQENLYGYAPVDSEIAKTLDQHCDASPRGLATVILRVRALPASASPRGVVIEKVVAPRWVYVEEPKDAP